VLATLRDHPRRHARKLTKIKFARLQSFSQSSMVFKMTSLQDSERLAIINVILDCGISLQTTPIRNLNFHASEHARIRNHKHLEMQSCLDCSKLAQTCDKQATN